MADDYHGDERRRQAWHLDKRVPIAIFFLLAGQGLALVYWAGKLSKTVEQTAQQNVELAKRVAEIEERERLNGKLVERLVRVETLMENVYSIVYRIDRKDRADNSKREQKGFWP